MERLIPASDEDLPQFERTIQSILLGIKRQEAWDRFARELREKYPVQESMGGLQAILQDSLSVLLEAFKKNQPAFVFQLDDDEGVTGTEFREELAYSFKGDTNKPFRAHFKETRDMLINQLALAHEAARLGYADRPAVQDRLDQDWEERLPPGLRRRGHRQQRGGHTGRGGGLSRRAPGHVPRACRGAPGHPHPEGKKSRRTRRPGACTRAPIFGRIFSEYSEGRELSPTKSRFIKETELSDEIRQELVRLEPGQCGNPHPMGMGYMIFRLDARRPGAVAPLAEASGQIRKHLFKQNFDAKVQENSRLPQAEFRDRH